MMNLTHGVSVQLVAPGRRRVPAALLLVVSFSAVTHTHTHTHTDRHSY